MTRENVIKGEIAVAGVRGLVLSALDVMDSLPALEAENARLRAEVKKWCDACGCADGANMASELAAYRGALSSTDVRFVEEHVARTARIAALEARLARVREVVEHWRVTGEIGVRDLDAALAADAGPVDLATQMASNPDFVRRAEEGWQAIDEGRCAPLSEVRRRLGDSPCKRCLGRGNVIEHQSWGVGTGTGNMGTCPDCHGSGLAADAGPAGQEPCPSSCTANCEHHPAGQEPK